MTTTHGVILLSLSLLCTGCGMGDACEELSAARCDCDEAMCADDESDKEVDDERLQACKEELRNFECEAE
jgi:hypothetical protein